MATSLPLRIASILPFSRIINILFLGLVILVGTAPRRTYENSVISVTISSIFGCTRTIASKTWRHAVGLVNLYIPAEFILYAVGFYASIQLVRFIFRRARVRRLLGMKPRQRYVWWSLRIEIIECRIIHSLHSCGSLHWNGWKSFSWPLHVCQLFDSCA